MDKVTFFNLGNADTTLIATEKGSNILIDYAHMRSSEQSTSTMCTLPEELNSRVAADTFDLVAFTHLDNDHVCGAEEYFHLDHAIRYQGGERKKIKTLLVPANVICENRNDLQTSATLIQAEARYRLKQGTGIRIVSKPGRLREWMESRGIDYDSRKNLITDAGQLVPEVSKIADGVELFIHSPFADTSKSIDRNGAALVLHATFNNTASTKMMLGSDIDHSIWCDIIEVTKYNDNDELRLTWDIFHLSHHCSYKSLSETKGTRETVPDELIREMFEEYGNTSTLIISPSFAIDGDYERVQPPHQQAFVALPFFRQS